MICNGINNIDRQFTCSQLQFIYTETNEKTFAFNFALPLCSKIAQYRGEAKTQEQTIKESYIRSSTQVAHQIKLAALQLTSYNLKLTAYTTTIDLLVLLYRIFLVVSPTTHKSIVLTFILQIFYGQLKILFFV